ncbi:MAG TPA: hypothetical protein VIK53_12355 [Verrucomicrobiae bacterium]
MLWLLAIGLCIGVMIFLGHTNDFIVAGSILVPFPLLVLPFGVRLYRKWIGGHLTDAEKLPGIDGVRAWLGFGNVICAVLIAIDASLVFRTSMPAMFALTFGALLAYPLLNMAFGLRQARADSSRRRFVQRTGKSFATARSRKNFRRGKRRAFERARPQRAATAQTRR